MRLMPQQIAAGMALAGLNQEELSRRANISRPTLSKVLNNDVLAKDETLRRLRLALEQCGIEFIGSIGVQWAQHHVRTMVGLDGLKAFFDDVRAVARKVHEDIVICGFSEDYFEAKLGAYLDHHRSEMLSYPDVSMRCLVRNRDFNLNASGYCRYRWQPPGNLSDVPFYVYGDRSAIIVTSAPEDPLIILIQNQSVADAYRAQFNALWQIAEEPKA